MESKAAAKRAKQDGNIERYLNKRRNTLAYVSKKDVRDEVCSTFTWEIYARQHQQQQHGPFPLCTDVYLYDYRYVNGKDTRVHTSIDMYIHISGIYTCVMHA